MAKRKVVFRADGNSEIGLGHIMRSLALAEMLMNDFECWFATRYLSDFIQKEINKICTKLIELPKDDSHFNTFLQILEGTEIVVLDNYFFTSEYQRQIKEKNCKLVCIDDLADKHFYADVVINHSPCISISDYKINSETRLAMGFNYSLLRLDFFNKPNVKRSIRNFKTVFLSFGGSNNLELITKFLTFFAMTRVDRILVLVPFSIYQELLTLSKQFTKEIELFTNIGAKDLIALVEDSNVAIVPSSTMSFEMIACNIPLITGYFVDNQYKIYQSLRQYDVIAGLGNFETVTQEKFIEIFTAYEKKVIMSNFSMHLISSNVPQNFKKLFKTL